MFSSRRFTSYLQHLRHLRPCCIEYANSRLRLADIVNSTLNIIITKLYANIPLNSIRVLSPAWDRNYDSFPTVALLQTMEQPYESHLHNMKKIKSKICSKIWSPCWVVVLHECTVSKTIFTAYTTKLENKRQDTDTARHKKTCIQV
jgi:hypothetical protein